MALLRLKGFLLMYKRFLLSALIVTAVSVLTACEGFLPQNNEKSLVAESDPVSLRLADAAEKASTALQNLARMEQNQKPPVPPPPTNAPAELNRHVTVYWTGPVEQLVKKLAQKIGYDYTLNGKPPAVPVIVAIDVIDRPIIDVFRTAGDQVTNRADIMVDVPRRMVELRYAPKSAPME
jgi:defect-in-organelle-trafficking protein DotD